MADIAVEKNEIPVVEKKVEKVAEEVDAKKSVTEEASTTENGAADATDAKENGAAAESKVDADAPTCDAVDDAEKVVDSSEAAAEENGDDKEANGDSTDSAPAEAVKRKVAVVEGDAKSEAAAATPEKKAKLDEPTKEDVQNGSEASEVAA